MAKKKVSVKRPEGSTTSMLACKIGDKRVVLNFNKQGVARVDESISKSVLKLFPSLTLMSVTKESEEE